MVGKIDFGKLVCKCGNEDVTECYRGDEHYYFCDICNKRVEQEQLKPTFEAYPGWKFIIDMEGALHHVPGAEWLAQRQWQTIETVPKDGTQVLLSRLEDGFIINVMNDFWYQDRVQGGFDEYNETFDEPPTHWMLLPEPPRGIKCK